jgi:hypothetical protein
MEQSRFIAAHDLAGYVEDDYIVLQIIAKLHRYVLLLFSDIVTACIP